MKTWNCNRSKFHSVYFCRLQNNFLPEDGNSTPKESNHVSLTVVGNETRYAWQGPAVSQPVPVLGAVLSLDATLFHDAALFCHALLFHGASVFRVAMLLCGHMMLCGAVLFSGAAPFFWRGACHFVAAPVSNASQFFEAVPFPWHHALSSLCIILWHNAILWRLVILWHCTILWQKTVL